MFLSDTNSDFFKNKRVLVRIDCDVDLRPKNGRLVVDEDFRLRSVLPTIHFLEEVGAKGIILIGHLGRPGGKVVSELSLQPIADWFSQKLATKVPLFSLRSSSFSTQNSIILLENLRFDSGEENNTPGFARRLAALADIYVNDAFAVSHRRHASIVDLPKLLPSFLGLRFEAEVKTLSWIKKKAHRPIVFVLGGSKSGKLDYIPFLASWADCLLVGGKLPLLIKSQKSKVKSQNYNAKVKIGHLRKNNRDISATTIEQFKKIIAQAKTIIWAGPMGVYEEEENQRGTLEIGQAIAGAEAFKLAGGGDTHRVLSWFNLWENFDFVSVGGGAMLQFLRDETLPGMGRAKIDNED